MTRTLRVILGAVVVFLLSGWPAPVASPSEPDRSAWQPGGEQPAPEKGAARTLVYERELFAYPAFQRRNPFQPPAAPVANGPVFEEIRLLGIIHHRDARLSVVLLGTGGLPGIETFRLRLGDALGSTRIVEIDEGRVVVEVAGPDGPSRKTLRLPRATGRGVP